MNCVVTPPIVRLRTADSESITQLAHACAKADGVFPLNETARIGLRSMSPSHTHWLALVNGEIVGYAQADTRERTVQLMVHPDARHKGIGTKIIESVSGMAQSSWWSFGNLDRTRALAAHLGFRRVRELLMMRLTSPTSDNFELLEGFELSHYRADDLDELVRVNHAAFAHHPEQGGMTASDATARMAEDWFNPAGLVVARDAGGHIVGFHWTKVSEENGHLQGEVYVIGVDPAYEGKGIGRALLSAGIQFMQKNDAETIDLYVEASNPRVVDMYTRAGFSVASSDIAYARSAVSDAPAASEESACGKPA